MRADRSAAPGQPAVAADSAASSSNSGRLQRPAQTPVGSRRTRKTRSRQRSSSQTVSRRLRLAALVLHRKALRRAGGTRRAFARRRGRAGRAARVPGRRWRRDPSAPGCTFRCRVREASAVAACHSSRSAAAAARSPSNASRRASTRLTLPSRIATRSPKQNAAIAAAVERPMPGRRRELGAARAGNEPPCSATTTPAQRCRLRARP